MHCIDQLEILCADAMKFRGPAPEAINGRLAMAGIVWGAISEARTGLPIAELFKNSTLQILLFAAIVSYASLIPILKGARSEAFGKSSSPHACWFLPTDALAHIVKVKLPQGTLLISCLAHLQDWLLLLHCP